MPTESWVWNKRLVLSATSQSDVLSSICPGCIPSSVDPKRKTSVSPDPSSSNCFCFARVAFIPKDAPPDGASSKQRESKFVTSTNSKRQKMWLGIKRKNMEQEMETNKTEKKIVAVIYHARWSVSNHRPTKTNTHMKKICLHDTRGCHLVNYLAIAKLNSFFVIPCFPWKLRGRGQSFAFDVSKFSFSANLVGCLCSFNSDKHLQRNCYIHLPCFINPSSPVTRWSFISQDDILHECRWCVLEFVMFVV